MREIYWTGDIYVSNKIINRNEYSAFFEGKYINIHTLNNILKDADRKHVGVSCEYLKPVLRNDIANAVTFGIFPKYGEIGFQNAILCKENGREIPFDSLPVMWKAGIVNDILENGKKSGKAYINE